MLSFVLVKMYYRILRTVFTLSREIATVGTHYTVARENEGTERDNQGVGWDMSIPLKLFLTLDENGRQFPYTSA